MWTLGVSADFFDGEAFGLPVSRDQVNPKLGVAWNPFPWTTIRAAAFRTLKRQLVTNQTIEPTQVAGFNQFFDDVNGTDAWRYGGAIDQRISDTLYAGAEYSRRDLERVPFQTLDDPPRVGEVDWKEELARAYLYWAPHPWLALSAEYQYERFERDPAHVGVEQFTELSTHRVPLGVSFFHPSGLIARLRATFVDQNGKFGDPVNAPVVGRERPLLGRRCPDRLPTPQTARAHHPGGPEPVGRALPVPGHRPSHPHHLPRASRAPEADAGVLRVKALREEPALCIATSVGWTPPGPLPGGAVRSGSSGASWVPSEQRTAVTH